MGGEFRQSDALYLRLWMRGILGRSLECFTDPLSTTLVRAANRVSTGRRVAATWVASVCCRYTINKS